VSSPNLRAAIWEYKGRNGEPTQDLHTLFEDILVSVWEAEANWAFDDRLDLALSASAAAANYRR
jgi:hypothetical protein